MNQLPTVYKLDVVAENGVPFRVVLLTDGVSEHYGKLNDKGESEVEFYDRRYAHTLDGQFTGARYYTDTLLEDRGWNPKKAYGFNLHGGVDSWHLDQDTYAEVIEWVAKITRTISG